MKLGVYKMKDAEKTKIDLDSHYFKNGILTVKGRNHLYKLGYIYAPNFDL